MGKIFISRTFGAILRTFVREKITNIKERNAKNMCISTETKRGKIYTKGKHKTK